MHNRPFTILSTATIPFERIPTLDSKTNIQVMPFIKIIPVPCLELKPKITALGNQAKTIVFTSAHAVKIVAECLNIKPDWQIYCIRHETRKTVEFHFGASCIAGYAENASVLSQLMTAEGVLQAYFFCGSRRMNVLPENLKNQKIRLHEIVVYETQLTPVPINEHPDAILFFSPSAVQSFFSLNTLDSETAVFAMGSTTASALKKIISVPVNISPEADKAVLVKMALDYAANHPIE